MIPPYESSVAGEQGPASRALRRSPDGRRNSRLVGGIVALTVAVICLFLTSLLPSGFVIRQPGPVVNTLGSVQDAEGNDVPLISVPSDIPTYETDGTLSLTTVQVVGNRESTPSWFQLAAAWFDPSKAVMDLDVVFPEDQTTEERQEEDAVMMISSQQTATAAALRELGYEVPMHVVVSSVTEDGAANGLIQPDDIVHTIDGQPVSDVLQMRERIAAGGGADVVLNITRGDETMDVTVTPREGEVEGEKMWLIGVSAGATFNFPIDITIQLENIGGPSAGMMFALGIIDTMTEGEMNGGKPIAGTGTMDPAGNVGPIGGIQQKLFGAKDAGAEYFLAPADNCPEVIGHIPADLDVVKVSTLEEAQKAVETIGAGSAKEIAALPSCTAK